MLSRPDAGPNLVAVKLLAYLIGNCELRDLIYCILAPSDQAPSVCFNYEQTQRVLFPDIPHNNPARGMHDSERLRQKIML